MRQYTINLPLAPLRVGQLVGRSAWPLHVTLVGNFRLPAHRQDLLLDVVHRWAAASQPLLGTVRGEAVFGPDGDVHVDLVDPEDLAGPHRALATLVRDEVGGEPLTANWFGGFRPHVSRTAAGRAAPGRLRLPTVAVAELDPEGVPGTAVVLASRVLGA